MHQAERACSSSSHSVPPPANVTNLDAEPGQHVPQGVGVGPAALVAGTLAELQQRLDEGTDRSLGSRAPL
jgi:hypothetical protein